MFINVGLTVQKINIFFRIIILIPNFCPMTKNLREYKTQILVLF